MNFPPEVKPLQSADCTNFRSDDKVACVFFLDSGSVWKCKLKVNANYFRHMAKTALLVTRVTINNFSVLNQILAKV